MQPTMALGATSAALGWRSRPSGSAAPIFDLDQRLLRAAGPRQLRCRASSRRPRRRARLRLDPSRAACCPISTTVNVLATRTFTVLRDRQRQLT